jgi:hypothetical protein
MDSKFKLQQITKSVDITYPLINIILEYTAGLNNTKYKPVLNLNTGKLNWKINKYNKSTQLLNKMLQFKLNYPPLLIPILSGFLECNAIISCLSKYSNELFTQYEYMLEYERNGYTEYTYMCILFENNLDYDNEYNHQQNYIIKKCYVFRYYLPDPTFWIEKVDDVIWNDYGITLIINDVMDGWEGVWTFVANEWKFIINLPPEFLDLHINVEDEDFEEDWIDDNFDP